MHALVLWFYIIFIENFILNPYFKKLEREIFMRELKLNGVYRHYKGDLYIVEDIIYHSETCEKMVAYRALYGDNKLWCRPYDMICF